jgi:hypothetical protein
MLRQLQLRAGRSTAAVLFAAFTILAAVPAFAQNREQSSLLADTFKRVVFDPTTYAPAALAYDATMRDWNSSQVFFRNGYVEYNERFTISGRPKDIPIGYAAGRRLILTDALVTLQMSAVNNVADQLFERMLANRFPEHRKLVRTLGWIERLSFGSYLSYRLSAAHYRQAAQNETTAKQLGFK